MSTIPKPEEGASPAPQPKRERVLTGRVRVDLTSEPRPLRFIPFQGGPVAGTVPKDREPAAPPKPRAK